jgi:hypothetical protein
MSLTEYRKKRDVRKTPEDKNWLFFKLKSKMNY